MDDVVCVRPHDEDYTAEVHLVINRKHLSVEARSCIVYVYCYFAGFTWEQNKMLSLEFP